MSALLLVARAEATYARPNIPGRLVHLDGIRGLLLALAAFFALLGVAGLLHALGTSSRRHRGFFASLRSLGFLRRQVVRSVVICAVAIVGVGAAVGIPLGVVIGRRSWLIVVRDLGIVDTPIVPAPMLALVAALALSIAAVVAAVPAWRAAGRRPADLLRVE